MCRLLGLVGFSSACSAAQRLGADRLAEFTEMSRHHSDGWGVYGRREDGRSLFHHSALPAYSDPDFKAFCALPLRRAVFHLRKGSPGLPLGLAECHPFMPSGISSGWALAHNGTIAMPDEMRRRLSSPLPPREWLRGGTDSELFAALIGHYLGSVADLKLAFIRAHHELRQAFPNSSLNSMLLHQGGLLVAASASAARENYISQAEAIFGSPLPKGHDEKYFNIYYQHDGRGLVVTSSGISCDATWKQLPEGFILWAAGEGSVSVEPLPEQTQLSSQRESETKVTGTTVCR